MTCGPCRHLEFGLRRLRGSDAVFRLNPSAAPCGVLRREDLGPLCGQLPDLLVPESDHWVCLAAYACICMHIHMCGCLLLTPCLSLALSFSLSLSLSLSLCLCLSLSLCVFVSLSLSLCLCLSVCLPDFVSLSLSLSLSLPPSLVSQVLVRTHAEMLHDAYMHIVTLCTYDSHIYGNFGTPQNHRYHTSEHIAEPLTAAVWLDRWVGAPR